MAGLPTDELADVARIERIIGEFVFISSTINTVTYGRFGIIPVTLDAFSAGAVPETIGDFEAPWWTNRVYNYDGDLASNHTIPFDWQPKRPWYKNLALSFVLDVASGANANTEWSLHTRILYSHK